MDDQLSKLGEGLGASPAGHQRRKRGAVDCTPAQEVAVPLLASRTGNTDTVSEPRLRSGRNSAHYSKCSALA